MNELTLRRSQYRGEPASRGAALASWSVAGNRPAAAPARRRADRVFVMILGGCAFVGGTIGAAFGGVADAVMGAAMAAGIGAPFAFAFSDEKPQHRPRFAPQPDEHLHT